ncbi:MAG: TIGR02302 family protein [Rhodospirillales bacterium]
MTDRRDTRHSGMNSPSLSGVLWRTGWSMSWERAISSLWLPAAIIVFGLGLAISGILPALPVWLHLAVLVLFAGATCLALVRGLRGFRLPGGAEIRARVEQSNKLVHRPIEAVEDRLAEGNHNSLTTALWRLHQQRERARLAGLNSAAPRPTLAGSDRYAAVGGACLLLLVGFVVGDGRLADRVAAAAVPDFSRLGTQTPLQVELWITPPAYTRLAPVYLTYREAQKTDAAGGEQPADQQVVVPSGSRLLVSLQGRLAAPVLDTGAQQTPLSVVGESSFTLETELAGGTTLRFADGDRTLAEWPVSVVADRAPTISYIKPPTGDKRNQLALEYEISDDFGVEDATATIRRPDGAEILEGSPREIAYTLPLPGLSPTGAKSRHTNDLTAHPWAGLMVSIQLSVTDATGQTGETEQVEMTLPERSFNQPAARMVVGARKQLTLHPTDRETVFEVLNAISARPPLFNSDIGVFLALRSAAARLRYAPENAAGLASIQELLWTIALRIEDGELALAERRLAEAEKRLQEAMDRDDVTDAEMQQLMNELAQAMQEYFKELAQKLQEMGPSDQPIDPDAQVLSSREMQDMLEQMRQLNEIGAKEAAKQMLSQLRQMLEQMKNMPLAGMRQQPGQNGEMQKRMGQMQEMMRRQQELMDQTFRNGQQQQQRGVQGQQQSQEDMKRGAGEQEALRRQLGEMMRQLGENGQIPDALGRAERSMRDAAKQLGEGSAEDAMQAQGDAMNALREGARDMAEQMARQQQMGRQPGNGQGGRGNQQQLQGDGRDPLGRRFEQDRGGEVDDGRTTIPTKGDVQRARDILDELRRRSGDTGRPETELDYIDRLLETF